MSIKAIITGTTGMVGRGVLLECLKNNDVESVLIINRKPAGIQHPKLKEIIHKDFFDLSAIQDELSGYTACYFCLGISSFRMPEADYTRITYDLTLNLAKTLLSLNAEMTFCYVSGSGTDSTEKGSSMWARVKGKTENDIIGLGFKDAYAFRPAYIKFEKDTPTATPIYKVLMPIAKLLHPLIKFCFPNYTSTTTQIGKAMLSVSLISKDVKVLEAKDINRIGGEA